MLNINNLSGGYKKFQLKDISLHLPKGYVMGLIGENGAGKTTLIKLIMDLIKRKNGKIYVDGFDNIDDGVEVRKRIGFVYDETPFYKNLKLKDMTSIIRRFYPDWNQDKYSRLIKSFGLDESKKIMELSRGMSSKYMLATALSHGAKLLILDEPTSGIDPASRVEMLDILREELEDGEKSILFSTHITTDLEKIADYITMLKDGKVQFSGSRDDFIDSYHIIKCDPKIIDDQLLSGFIGHRTTSLGFEGLTDNDDLVSILKYNSVIERPSMDDIMYFSKKGDLCE
ncbi:ABC transporter ATP-binding protein [Microaceticoccus formicicus]|uniref:ABC transporter ATP-binding protein n=1 Tax=Microaceticoccus formicicus TaxID=3118105 RepID=UPI003CD00A48|nr:ABC transporter ATP-binding protein [Peptoniphilaceae bacterium AMB_02]